MRRVMKWSVPVDDQFHPIGQGKVVMVDTQFGDREVVHVWTEEECDSEGRVQSSADRAVIVIGTGQAVPNLTEHIGSVIPASAGGHLVWHVFGGV